MGRMMNDLLKARVAAQQGAFTTRDAADCGYVGRALTALVRSGVARRVGPSAYVDRALQEAASPEQAHAMAVRAFVLTFAGRSAASHYSALALMGLPIHRAPLGVVHLARTRDNQSRRGAGLVVHQAYGEGALCRVGSTVSVIPALAVLGTAMACGIEAGVVAADAALARGRTTPVELADWLERLSRSPRLTAARQVVALADGRCESPGESRTRVILHGLGIRDVDPQVVIRDGDGRVVARVDFLLGRSPVVIEFDGKIKYDGVNGRQALVDEKVREDRLRALGYEIVRLTWADLARPARVKVMVLAAVQRAHGRGRAPLRAG